MEKAIKKAIEGGFEVGKSIYPFLEDGVLKRAFEDRCLLDPLFWQALGKAEGWTKVLLSSANEETWQLEWERNWHDFIDHLIEDKDINTFFEELLN